MTGNGNAVLVIGAAEEALEVISSLYLSKDITVVGVVGDALQDPGMRLADALKIPASIDSKTFLNDPRLSVVIVISDDESKLKNIRPHLRPGTEIVNRRGAHLITQLAESISFAAEARYLSVFQNMLSGVAYHKILYDEKGKPVDYMFMEVNGSFERILGLKKEDIIGKKVTELFPWIKDSSFNWIDFYARIAASGKEVSFEQYLKNIDRWYSVSAYSTQRGYFITIYNDITERRETEVALRKAYETLKNTQDQLIQTEKMEVVGRLASGVAHEVKNPLAVLQQGVDYLSKKLDKPEEDILFALKAMGDAASRANIIIRGLTDFSRVSEMKVNPEDLNTLIEHCLLMVEADTKRYGVEVVKDLHKRISKVKVDKNRIQQVFINLFMNAIQAMPEGGQLKISTVEKKHSDTNRQVIVKIEDTGSGIDGDIMGKIFDPFFTTKDVGKGTGLGLSIVSNIMEGHGGKIIVENRKETRGTRVLLTFKIEQ